MKLKVYGGHLYGSEFGRRGSRVIVAAHSWTEVARLVDTPLGHLRNYWAMTWNYHELKVALGKPMTVFFVADSEAYKSEPDFRELKKR